MKNRRKSLLVALLATVGVMARLAFGAEEADPTVKAAGEIIKNLPGATDNAPAFTQEWKSFAETSGHPEDKRWVELISDPQSIKLSNAWAKWKGYDAPSLVAQARKDGKIPAEVKPGLIVTAENIDKIPGLKSLFTKAVYDRIKDPNWYGFKQIRIVPTTHLYLPAGRLKGFLEEKGEFQLDYATGGLRIKNCTTCSPGETVADDWGQKSVKFPFVPIPKDGVQLAWDYVLNDVISDQVHFRPLEFNLCDANNKLERTYVANLWWARFWGRASWAPGAPHMPGIPEKDFQGGAIYFMAPIDVKGLCGVKIRHFDPNIEDSFAVFIPFLKRVRILAGSDTQDPLCAGCDLNWEDWRSLWQRVNTQESEYTLEGDTFILSLADEGMVSENWEVKDCQHPTMNMEIRPVWILKTKDKTGKHMYSGRTAWVDKDFWYIQDEERYDRQGRSWRYWIDSRYWDPRSGEGSWRNVLIWDPTNKHATVIRMNAPLWQAEEQVKKEYFDIETLKNYR